MSTTAGSAAPRGVALGSAEARGEGLIGRPVSADGPWSSTSSDAVPNPGAASRSYAVHEPTRSADSGTGSSTAGRGAEMRGADGRAAAAKEGAGGATGASDSIDTTGAADSGTAGAGA